EDWGGPGDAAGKTGGAFPVAEARTLLADRARIEERLETILQTFESTTHDAGDAKDVDNTDNTNGGNGTGVHRAGLKIRTHGDLHLGQILIFPQAVQPGMPDTADDRLDAGILDFEGEPGRPLAA